MPAGDAKLSKCDESTICPGIFLCGPQVRQDDQIFCFVYKYRQRFAVVMNEIATRLGLQTQKVVAECREQHMFLDDTSGCEATCGASCATPGAHGVGERTTGSSRPPLVRIEAKSQPKYLKLSVAHDLRMRSQEVTKAQEALADASAIGDLDTMAKLLDAGLAKVQRTSIITLGGPDGEPESNFWTPLQIVAQTQNIAATKFLLERGADPNFTAYTRASLTALLIAVMGSASDAELVKLLIEHGADVNHAGPDGATALHFACDMGFEECAIALIQAGCRRELKDDEGMTGQEVATHNGNASLVAALNAAVAAYEKKITAAHTDLRGGKHKRDGGESIAHASREKRVASLRQTGPIED